MHSRPVTVSVGMLVALMLPAGALTGQSISGRVVDETTGAPLAATDLVIPDLKLRIVTDSNGVYLFPRLPAGWHRVLVRRLGYRPVVFLAELRDAGTRQVDVELMPSPVVLDPLEVNEAAPPDRFMRQYYDRQRFAGGMGTFIGPERLRQVEYRTLGDLLRTTRGVQPVFVRGKTFLTSSRDHCPMQIYLDGMRLYAPTAGAMGAGGPSRGQPPDISQFHIAHLEAIEVYPGPAETPAELGGTGAGCGTVVLWTRRR